MMSLVCRQHTWHALARVHKELAVFISGVRNWVQGREEEGGNLVFTVTFTRNAFAL